MTGGSRVTEHPGAHLGAAASRPTPHHGTRPQDGACLGNSCFVAPWPCKKSQSCLRQGRTSPAGWDPTSVLLQHIISVLLKLPGQQVWGKLSRAPFAMGHNGCLVSASTILPWLPKWQNCPCLPLRHLAADALPHLTQKAPLVSTNFRIKWIKAPLRTNRIAFN